ncbi:MAG TPA: hypothetical protein VNN79_15005, partial [Actinomycetota bacterium]|nr:hypothetical protein [Actinomycetota bacterium]
GCLPDVTLASAWTSRRKGHYDPELRVVTIRIPGTAPNLSATMVHEFAHHLDFSCPDRPLRRAFLADQGLPAGSYWRHGPSWDAVPAEQFAQAVIPVVLGPQPDLGIVVRPASLRDIRAWARGD